MSVPDEPAGAEREGSVPAPRKSRRRRRRSRRAPPGASPGLLFVDPEAPRPTMAVLSYGPGELEECPSAQPADLAALLGRRAVTWVDVDGLGDAGLVRDLGECFGLHRLALADVVHTHQRAKVERYEQHLFIVLRMLKPGERLDTEQLSIFLGRDFVLTFQEGIPGDCLEPVRERIRRGVGRIRGAGPDYLTYALLDAVIDGYFPLLEAHGERLEALEDEVIHRPDGDCIARIHDIKRDLLTLRRAVWPLRDALGVLLRETPDVIAPETRPYLRDCYDHCVQIIDLVETYRELGSGLMDVYLSSLSNRMNEVMKVLTIIATIFIPLSFIAGVYGMNFSPQASPLNMPELDWYWGYPFALALMGVVALGLLCYFWRKGWLGGNSLPGR
jgi:magnesium transporter